MRRILDAMGLALRYRRALIAYLAAHPAYDGAARIDLEALKGRGVRALALDFDGVLAPHGDPEPLPEMIDWIDRAEAVFGSGRVFILTNKPTAARAAFFARRFPRVEMIVAPRKKPYPDGVLAVIARCGASPEAVALVDDRLLTGALAACQAQAGFVFIHRPFTRARTNPIPEGFFAVLRGLERLFLGWRPPG